MYPQQQPGPPRRRKSNRGLVIALSVFAVLGLCIVSAAAYGLTRPDKPATSPTAPASSPAVSPSQAQPGTDLGAGTPGAGCSTDRLGKTFVKDGITYTCKGPKPYTWQK
jgi:hypothetical protein